MEDGHSLFDYSVGLNDIVQLLVRQSPAVLPAVSKEKDPELSDTDSGCGSGQSESDKSSHNGEGALELEGQPGTAAQPDWTDPGFGLYKVRCSRAGVPGSCARRGIVPLWGIDFYAFILWALVFCFLNPPPPSAPQSRSLPRVVGQGALFFILSF